MDPHHRRHRGTAPRRLLPLVLGLAALLLGLLGMHTLGVDHRLPGVAAGHSAAAHAATGDPGPAAAHAGAGEPHAAAAAGRHLFAAPRTAADPVVACGDGCHLELAMAGMCVVALSAAPVLLRLGARAVRPTAGRGPAARPPSAAPRSRAAPRPSLLQLSISRT